MELTTFSSVIFPSGKALVDIRSVSQADAGTYVCRAQSPAGTKEERVEVIGMSCFFSGYICGILCCKKKFQEDRIYSLIIFRKFIKEYKIKNKLFHMNTN